jgi:hypothetical protein
MQIFLDLKTVEKLIHQDEYKDVIIPETPYKEGVEEVPHWNIEEFKFYPTSQMAHIVFCKLTAHKLNPKAKNPTYKITTQMVTYKIHLSNSVLEKLDSHEDPIIRRFAQAIIYRIQNPQFWPSWYRKEFLSRLLMECQENISSNEKIIHEKLTKQIEENEIAIQSNKFTINGLQLVIYEHSPYVHRYGNRINKIENYNKPWKWILSLGLYGFIKSSKNIAKLRSKYERHLNAVESAEKHAFELVSTNEKLTEEITNIREAIRNNAHDAIVKRSEVLEAYENALKEIVILSDSTKSCSNFIPLDQLYVDQYVKAAGCYVIKNNHCNKCFVDTSKDVIKRLKQQFQDGVPTNLIFAEDYYAISKENRKKVFSVCWFECSKEDQNSYYKELVEIFDSINCGYNREEKGTE